MALSLLPTAPGCEGGKVESVTPISRVVQIRDRSQKKPIPFWRALREDILAHLNPGQRRMTRWGWLKTAVRLYLSAHGVRVVFRYRLAHTLVHRGWIPGRIGAYILAEWNRFVTGCGISPRAWLGGGLVLPHPHGIMIGAGTVIGPRAWIFHNVTIGGAPGKGGRPNIGSDARIYCGALVSGPITLGDHVIVGANSVVTRDVPKGTLVRAAPVAYVPGPAIGNHPCWKT
jgi:serine O-acetyltransferase